MKENLRQVRSFRTLNFPVMKTKLSSCHQSFAASRPLSRLAVVISVPRTAANC